MTPNFFVVGAAKSGTTSLYHYLKQHPQIFLPINKEPSFFSFYKTPLAQKLFAEDFKHYKLLYSNAKKGQAIGDMSITYLYFYQETIKNIKHFIEDHQSLRFVILLRNPIQRAFSHFLMYQFMGFTSYDFDTTIRLDITKRTPDKLDYLEMGLYFEQVRAYLENFPNIKIYLYEDLQNDSRALLADLMSFLEIDASFPINIKYKYRTGGSPKSPIFNLIINKLIKILSYADYPAKKIIYSDNLKLKLLKIKYSILDAMELIRTKNLKKERVSESSKAYLIDFYREDICKLQSLIKRDLSDWLK